ncbi:MAG: hypothetical protein ACRCWI_04890 [Brevinema sp.]
MNLLRYDTRHIRVFQENLSFIKFSHFQDELLPIADSLFAQSSSIKITPKQIQNCFPLLELNQAYLITIYHKNNDLLFDIQTPNFSHQYSLSKADQQYWSHLFSEQIEIFSRSDYLGIVHQGQSIMESFFEQLGIPLPSIPTILEISYRENFYFIPFEFLYPYFFVKVFIVSKTGLLLPKMIHSTSIMFDPNLELAYEESLYILKLLEKRSLQLNNKKAELLLVSAHGATSEGRSYLENQTLESLIIELSPHIVIFNSCVLARQPQGIIQHFIDKGTIVIASPFYTLCKKTIFAPILRFITNSGNTWTAFCLLKIFYPKIYKYFRIYFPSKH